VAGVLRTNQGKSRRPYASAAVYGRAVASSRSALISPKAVNIVKGPTGLNRSITEIKQTKAPARRSQPLKANQGSKIQPIRLQIQ